MKRPEEEICKRGRELLKRLEELKLLPPSRYNLKMIEETEKLIEINRTVLKGVQHWKMKR